MIKNNDESNFYALVNILKKYALGCGVKPTNRNIYKSKKYNAFVVKNHPCLSRKCILGREYMEKQNLFDDRQISFEEWNNFNNEFNTKNPGRSERTRHNFKLFIYLQNHNFCVDISENDVRTQIIEIPIPNKIIGGHNGTLANSFERALNKQLMKYISQLQTNIDVLKKLE